MDWKELQTKGESELQKLLKAQREKLRDLRFRVFARQLKDVRELRKTRKTIARILTVLNAQKRAGATPPRAATPKEP